MSVVQELRDFSKQCDSTCVDNLAACSEVLGTIFVVLEKHEEESDGDFAELLRAKALELAKLEVKSKATAVAALEVAERYEGSNAAARAQLSMHTELKAGAAAAHEAHPHKDNLRATRCWEGWCSQTGEEAAPADTFDDDDIQGISGGEFKNIKCTLTQMSIFELPEPVEDSHGWVWDRAAINEHIRRRGGQCPNPAQLQVQLTAAELKDCSKRIKRAANKNRRQMQTQTQVAEEIL